jgi:hypothetical protein
MSRQTRVFYDDLYFGQFDIEIVEEDTASALYLGLLLPLLAFAFLLL